MKKKMRKPKAPTSAKKITVNGSPPEKHHYPRHRKLVEKIFDGGDGELDRALYFAAEMFDRAGIVYFVMGEASRQMIEDNRLHQLPAITLGVVKSGWGETQRTLMKTVFENYYPVNLQYTMNEDGLEFFLEEVPIRLQVIKRHTHFFSNPDTLFYDYHEYRVPNSFKRYWQIRKMIR